MAAGMEGKDKTVTQIVAKSNYLPQFSAQIIVGEKRL